jgi:hypothetical protein
MRLAASMVLAIAGFAAANAQAQPWTLLPAEPSGNESTVLPILDQSSGRFEGLLLLDGYGTQRELPSVQRVIGRQARASDPATSLRTGAGTRIDLGTSLGQASDGLALLCDSSGALLNSIGALGEHCRLAQLDAGLGTTGLDGGVLGGSASLVGHRFRVDLGGRLERFELDGTQSASPVWLPESGLAGLGTGNLRLDQQSLLAGTSYRFGDDGWVSLDGSVARARLIPAPAAVVGPLDWIGTEVSLGVGMGNFSGEVTGRTVDAGALPGWSGLDIGVSWRTPWQGRLTIGTQNILTRGRAPWSLGVGAEAEGIDESPRTPYVRYQQDL